MRGLCVVLAALLSIPEVGIVQAQDADSPRLPDGLKVPVRLMQRLSSETAKTGEPVTFEVLEDILVNNKVVIKQGTPARGVVVEAAPKRRMGRAGKLTYAISESKTVERQTVRLRATQQRTGGSNVASTAVATTAVAVFVPVAAPFVLLRKGKDLVVEEGTRVDAFVDGEHVLSTVAPTQADATQKVNPVTSSSKLTNADVVSLKNAGFGDDLIIAKIQSSVASFTVDANDLLELKKRGVSDAIITAMLKAAR